jgi:DNA-binding transcriptional LysR family regulator
MVADSLTISSEGPGQVIQISEQSVQRDEHHAMLTALNRVRWDDLNVFLHVSERSSLRRAATNLGISVNTVRARLARLEKVLGTILFSRGPSGLRVTAEGEAVLRVTRDMHRLGSGLPVGEGNNILARDGEIRICASEGIGTFWLTPRLPDLKARLPELLVSLDSFADQQRLGPGDYDVSVGFTRPKGQGAIVSRLATVHMMPFASDQYLAERGVPTSLDDVSGHQCVQQDAPGLHYDAIQLFFTSAALRQLITYRVSSSYSLYWAVATGVGIGVLPTYMRALGKRLKPLDLPLQLRFELWLSYNQAARQSLPVRAAIDWLRDGFDPVRYPWFSEQFVHPDAFGSTDMDGQVIPLFDHVVDAPV